MVASYEFRRKFEPGYLGLVKTRGMRKRVCYGLYATSLQQIGGIAAVTMYATLIYKSLGWNSGSQALAINGIQSILQLFIVLVNTFTVDNFGRKALLLAGFSIQSLALLVMASLTTSCASNNNRAAAIVEVGMLFVVGLTYCLVRLLLLVYLQLTSLICCRSNSFQLPQKHSLNMFGTKPSESP